MQFTISFSLLRRTASCLIFELVFLNFLDIFLFYHLFWFPLLILFTLSFIAFCVSPIFCLMTNKHIEHGFIIPLYLFLWFIWNSFIARFSIIAIIYIYKRSLFLPYFYLFSAFITKFFYRCFPSKQWRALIRFYLIPLILLLKMVLISRDPLISIVI